MMTSNLQTSKTVTTVNDKATKFQLRLMMLYIVAVYIPFIIILLASPYNVFVTSLSKIAWRYDGLPLIILYGTLTIPFLLYEIHFYLKYNKRDKDALIRPLLAGCFILGVGIVFPSRGSQTVIQLHCIFSQIGAVTIILAITGIIRRFCKKINKDSKYKSVIVGLLYGTLLVVVAALFITTETPAMLEAGSSLVFMIVFYLVNKSSSAEHVEEEAEEDEDTLNYTGETSQVSV